MSIYRKVGSGISWSQGRPILDIFCRDQDNARHTIKVAGLPIYFYVDEKEQFEQEDMKSVLKMTHGYSSLYGKPVQKVFVKKISEMKRLGKLYNGYESDMRWDKKCLLDLKVTDMFAYENGKVHTLDTRFNALKEIELVAMDGGASTSSIVASPMDKEIVSSSLDELRISNTHKPHVGNTSFEVRHCTFDIEVIVASKEQLRTREGKIICVCLHDSYTGKVTELRVPDGATDRHLVIQVLEYFRDHDFDLISGWNVEFDMGWILSKANDYDLDLTVYFQGGQTMISKYTDFEGKYREKFYIGGRTLIDSMELYKKKTMTTEKLASYSLKAVNLVEGGDEYEDFGARVKEMWDKDPDTVVKYCTLDVLATVNIINRKDLMGGALTICKFFGCSFNEVSTNSLVIESMMFLMKKNRVLPNIVRGREKGDLVGAKVLKSTYGLHKNVAILDAGSLYPSIIQGLNVSAECVRSGVEYTEGAFKGTVINVDVTGNNVMLLKKDVKLGLMTEVIIEMRKLREVIRSKRMQCTRDGDDEGAKLANNEEKVAKGVLASVYGVMAFPGFRLYSLECASVITAVARGMVKTIVDDFKAEGCEVIYGDTDSVFIKIPNAQYGFEVMDAVNELTYQYIKKIGVDEHVINMNYEKFFRWVMFNKKASGKLKSRIYKKDTGTAKKKYIGYISHVQDGERSLKEVNDMYYKGFELRRSDSAKVLKVVMKKFFELMIDGDFMKSIRYLKEVKNEFPIYGKDYIAMPRSVNVEDANDPWANGKRYSIEKLGFEFDEDTMPKLLYVKPNYVMPKTDVICYQDGHDIPTSFEIDYDVMYDKLIKKKFEPIVESLGLFWDTSINSQSTLDAFA